MDGGEAAANHLKNSAHGGEILQVVNAFFGGGLNRSALKSRPSNDVITDAADQARSASNEGITVHRNEGIGAGPRLRK